MLQLVVVLLIEINMGGKCALRGVEVAVKWPSELFIYITKVKLLSRDIN